MCIGIPLQILAVDGIAATASDGSRTEVIDLSLTGPLPCGTWVLSFLGTAREIISAGEAALISEALAALADVMAGGDGGDAFADIDARGPQLPPHLAAAQAAGRSIA